MGSMTRSVRESGSRFWRSVAAAMAALALVYAATLTTAAHSLAVPAATPTAMAVGHAGHSDDHATALAGIDHADHQAYHDDADRPAKGPCDTGCTLCKDCALCSIAALAMPMAGPALLAVKGFILPSAGPPASHISSPPPEPPKA